jgi:hypothetical protein
MQLFLFGINLSADQMDHAEACVKAMDAAFPTLSMDTYWSHRQGDRVLLATVNHPPEATQPRCYRHIDDSQITLYDGVFIDPEGELRPNQATVLAQDWEGVIDRIEGQFIAARLDKATNRFEVYSDHLGLYNYFICEHAGGWLVSNSIRLLTRVRRRFELDPTGIAMALAYGTVFGDYTLQKGIRAVPGGHLLSFDGKLGLIQEQLYFNRVGWSQRKKRPFEELDIKRLAQKLARPMKQLAEVYGPLEAPITAGQDSRVILALLRSVDADAIYFSSGRQDLIDVSIGKKIASHFNLPHRWNNLVDKGLIEKWDELTHRLIQQTDGAVTFAHVASLYNQPKTLRKLPIHLYGAGGEFGKNIYVDMDFYLAKRSPRRLSDYLIKLYDKKKKAYTNEAAYQIGQQSIRRYVLELAREGFKNTDLLMAYFAFARFPRWAGANFKNVAPYADVYAPLCTRTFAQAAFSMDPIRRYCHSLHYQLIKHCLPQLHNLPIEHPFRTQRPDKNIAKLIYYGVKGKYKKLIEDIRKKEELKLPKLMSREYQRMKWLCTNMDQMRQRCLDQPQSLIWDFVKRKDFEKATAPGVSMTYVGHHQHELFMLFTLFAYTASENE